jgi:hypothetical protein
VGHPRTDPLRFRGGAVVDATDKECWPLVRLLWGGQIGALALDVNARSQATNYNQTAPSSGSRLVTGDDSPKRLEVTVKTCPASDEASQAAGGDLRVYHGGRFCSVDAMAPLVIKIG